MDKVCEFCMGLRPVIYCKADAAYLCLSCDAKVHSANALSNRHPRTPVCEACRYRPAHVRCSDHRMFMCHGCDCSLHKDSSQHQKQVISSFMGCPSAKDFAVLWGFELNKLENSTLQNQFVLTSCVSVDTGVKNSNFPRQSMSSPQTGGPSLASQASTVTSILGAEYEVGLSSQHTEVFNKGKQQQDTCIILQQIFDLERLQLTEGDKNSSLIRGKQTTDISSSTYDTSWKLDQSFQHSLGLGADPHQELNGEPLWQCRSPTQSFQLWSQNMQDLGICEELACINDFNIPDVDLTFQNFEEFFGCDQDLTRALFDDKDMTCSSVNKDTSLNGLDHSHAKEIEDASVASSVYIIQSANLDKDIGLFSCEGCSYQIRPSYSSLPPSLTKFGAESNATDYMEGCFSPVIAREESPCNSPELKGSESNTEGNAMLRHKDKKVRRSGKQNRYASHKARTDSRKRVRGCSFS
ncbi:zinc finger protein CONSTANS-LIKE 9-like isoform X2 [Camellia sinensis]|uniref:zinc finger protein CONSTANS-LIKE 9-like isoform X2 n=1 Tax=Camellia sinensis TaxID=4442 RepID=UPI001035EAF2|nr:zinc finger protein CONSTANS-LIKE 9-like isoform X2 [Camellia sinensis]